VRLFERYVKHWLVLDSGTIVFYDGAIVMVNLHMYSPRGTIHFGNGNKWYDETGIEYAS